jgi:hypothetical protein
LKRQQQAKPAGEEQIKTWVREAFDEYAQAQAQAPQSDEEAMGRGMLDAINATRSKWYSVGGKGDE